ncbi:MAG: DUF3179 domain-containing protein [Solirubrobacterales bacterium]
MAVVFALGLAGCGAGGGSAPDPGSVEFDTAAWGTDFSERSVPLEEFASGGPGKDGIPAIDRPRFVAVEEAERILEDRESIAVVEIGGAAKAYPIRIMVWHEIVNDHLGDRPIALTYCPLCNSTVAFNRQVGDRTLDFGTTGNLRKSDLVMYDRQTESWWQQLTGEAVVGELTGETLEAIPSQILSWREFKRLYPDGRVLSTETGHDRPYGENPYVGYEQPDSAPFALAGQADSRLPPKERVAAVQTGAESAIVYPFSKLRREAPLPDQLDGRPVVVFFDSSVASALDEAAVAGGRSVGAAAVFSRRLAGRTLNFAPGPRPGAFRDAQTGSTWTMDGRAVDGQLRGERLTPLVSDDQFWFALAAFFPEASIRR